MRRASEMLRLSDVRDMAPAEYVPRPGSQSVVTRGEDIMRVVVDYDLCESNALCMAAAPEVFEVREDDFLYVLQDEPPETQRAAVEEAVRRCPKQAITVQD